MSDKTAYNEFRQLLAKAMEGYSGTQADFAKQAGIAPETLNRLINNEVISRPSKMTLKKIASIAKNGVTYEMLLKACNYEGVPADNRSFKERMTDFDELIGCGSALYNGAYASVNEYVDMLLSLYSRENISYHIVSTVDAKKEDVHRCDKVALVNMSFTISETQSAEKDVLVYYYETKSDKAVVTCITDDLETAASYDSETARRILELEAESKQKEHFRSLIWSSKDKKVYEPMSSEELLLKTIFGEEVHSKTVNIRGIGFVLPKYIPEYVFKNFMRNHKDTFCRSEKEKKIYESYIEGDAAKDKVFRDYLAETVTGAGGRSWLAVIVNIIYREENINTQGWKTLDDHECVVFADSMPWDFNETERSFSRRSFMITLDKYARELRTEIGSISFSAEMRV